MRAFPKSIDIWSIILLGYVRLNKAVTEWTRMKENEKFDVFYAKRLNYYYYYFFFFFGGIAVPLMFDQSSLPPRFVGIL
jgi:hypothetical protein